MVSKARKTKDVSFHLRSVL